MKVRFGVVGTGHWAETVHIPGLKGHTGIELVGIWGRNTHNAKNISEKHAMLAFGSLPALFDAVDALTFAVPPDAQAALALKAAIAGKHLLLEKPIALTVHDAEALTRAISERDLASIVFFTRRFVPQFEEAIDDASRQGCAAATVDIQNGALLTGSPFAGSTWRQAEGGALWDLGPHALAAILPVFGTVDRIVAHRDANDLIQLTSWHASGAVAQVSLSIRVDSLCALHQYLFVSQAGSVSIPVHDVSRADVFGTAARELAENIRKREHQHRCDARFGLEIVRLLAAAERSIAENRPVTIGEL